jgi:hypothetical protein
LVDRKEDGMEDVKRPEEVAREEELEARLRGKLYNLSVDLVSAAIAVYHEIVEWHETSIRLTAEQFAAAERDLGLFMRCVIYLIASDLVQGKRVPLLTKMWLAPEVGEEKKRKGWVRVKLRLPSEPPSPRD